MDNVDNLRLAQGLPNRGPVLGVFAKEPRSGRVKTRFTPPLLPTEARALYQVALAETVERFSAGPTALVLCSAGRHAWFQRRFPGMALLPQGAGDLGARLAKATTALFAAGGSPVAVAGADSPDLPLAMIGEAFAALASVDAAAIPCTDGGFALLALRQPAPALFAGIPWSTSDALTAMQARAAQLGLRCATIGGWDDLDDLAALHRLLERSPECATARYARAHLGRVLYSGSG